jgi:DNA-binding CsgD family transcriptional regulator
VIPLTDRELDILLTYARLGTYLAVGKELGISRQTVANTLINVRNKLGVDSTIQALWLVLGEEAA